MTSRPSRKAPTSGPTRARSNHWTVRRFRPAGCDPLLQQAFIERQQHCNFTPSELVAGVLAVQHRVETGRWDSVAQPEALEATARSLDLGDAAFVPYQPDPLSGDNGPFDPLINGG